MSAKNAESFLEIGAAYIRVSTDDQTELSPDAQVRVIQEEAKKDGFFIPTEYIFIEHKGISGRKASNRPEFQKIMIRLNHRSLHLLNACICGSSHVLHGIRKKVPFTKASYVKNAVWRLKVSPNPLWRVCSDV